MKFLIGLILLPFMPIFKWLINQADIIEKSHIKDDSILILKETSDDSKIT